MTTQQAAPAPAASSPPKQLSLDDISRAARTRRAAESANAAGKRGLTAGASESKCTQPAKRTKGTGKLWSWKTKGADGNDSNAGQDLSSPKAAESPSAAVAIAGAQVLEVASGAHPNSAGVLIIDWLAK